MRILLLGKDGQVGYELHRTLAPLGEVVALGRGELELTEQAAIAPVVRAHRPQVIVNAAAYTAVDRAETERDLAFAVNAVAPGELANAAAELGALLVHYSTDYVFDGAKTGAYVENDEPRPLNAYGESKLAGERAVSAAGCRHLILRTSWVYASRGRNFLLTILRLARERRELRVVDDQHGAPTWARDIARATAAMLRRRDAQSGIYHVAAGGRTTWCGFAREIVRLAGLRTSIVPIATADHPTAATRPVNSALEGSALRRIFGYVLPAWRDSLCACMRELRLRE